jgi:hypothetical protein
MPNRDRPSRLPWLGLLAGALLTIGTLPAQARPMAFSRQGPAVGCDSCYWILAEGEIDAGTPGRFQAFLAQEPDAPRLVRLNSIGGLIAFGMRLGQLMREGGFDTVVGQAKVRSADGSTTTQLSNCYSACTIAFLGGVHRSIGDGVFGIHRPVIRPTSPDQPAFDAEQTETALSFWTYYIGVYALQMGISADFVSKTFADPSIRLLGHDDLVRLNIVTGFPLKPATAKPKPD